MFIQLGELLKGGLERRDDQDEVWAAVSHAQLNMASPVPGYQESTVSGSSYKLSLEDAALQKTVGEWFQVISDKSRVYQETVGLAVTINGCMEKIDWYGHAEVFRWQ